MASDTMNATAAAAIPKDIAGAGKKKRANRSAKLKQCKLDARREQWLSQVKSKDSNSTCKDLNNTHTDSKGTGMDSKGTSVAVSATSSAHPPSVSLSRDSAEVEREDPACHDSSDSESMTQSPTSGSECGSRENRRPARSFGSSSSGSSAGTSSWNVSDAELEDGEDGALDDWEAVADALTAGNDSSSRSIDPKSDTDRGSTKKAPNQASQKPEPIRPPTRAWRPDDASRPLSLPSLSKHRGFMCNVERQCGLSSDLVPPISCPICCEDLDATDVSFRPCPCGFCLCLFCHKRILEEDARCPGCRKQYSPSVEQAVNVGGGTSGSSIKLSRSCSMKS